MFDYCKLVSTIHVPALYPDLQANVCQVEHQALARTKDNFDELVALFKASKQLGCECFYQLVACAIACYSKRKSDLSNLEDLARNNKQIFETLNNRFPFVLNEEKRKETWL